jgi:large subunit ribosomal protein L25
MEQVTLTAAKREESGSRTARRLRRDGLVPAVVYGEGQETVAIAVSRKELYRTLHTAAGANAVIALEVEGGDTITTVAREIQRHPYRGTIDHLDFIKVDLLVEIDAEVHVEYVGVPLGVKDDGSLIETVQVTVGVRALPGNIPQSIEVDISHLTTGSSVKAAELPVLEGVEYTDPPDRTLVAVVAKRLAEVEEVLTPVDGEEEETEGEEEETEE